jgi:hypothetical protein
MTPHNLTDGSVLQQYGWECFEHPSYCPDLAWNYFCFLVLWRTILVTDAKLMWKCRKLSHSSFKSPEFSDEGRHSLITNTPWHMPALSGRKSRSFFFFLVINVSLNKNFLNRQKCTVFYSCVIDCHNVLIKAVIFRCV